MHTRGAQQARPDGADQPGAGLGRGAAEGRGHGEAHDTPGEGEAHERRRLGARPWILRLAEVVVRGQHRAHPPPRYSQSQPPGRLGRLPPLLERERRHRHGLALAPLHGGDLGPCRRAGLRRRRRGGVRRQRRKRTLGARPEHPAGRQEWEELRIPLRGGPEAGRGPRRRVRRRRPVPQPHRRREALGLEQPGDAPRLGVVGHRREDPLGDLLPPFSSGGRCWCGRGDVRLQQGEWKVRLRECRAARRPEAGHGLPRLRRERLVGDPLHQCEPGP
mmetsp:Transcript_24651/g.71276  ORF Transcript_24651/g.71276 Transcript_24651/m.71276 type:complete len:275 (-) Transcript_24651:1607-2431(-)